jgi:pimeloyl-ACP methyl ester carboxylesterase
MAARATSGMVTSAPDRVSSHQVATSFGEMPVTVTQRGGQEYAAAIPGATFRLVPDAGHLPQLEAPEAVLALLAETLP